VGKDNSTGCGEHIDLKPPDPIMIAQTVASALAVAKVEAAKTINMPWHLDVVLAITEAYSRAGNLQEAMATHWNNSLSISYKDG